MAQSLHPKHANAPTILDVREHHDSASISTAIDALRTQILAGLRKPSQQRSLPTLLLYDERGLRLYDDLTSNVHEYYLFAAEEQILTDHASEIVQAMGAGTDDAVVVELGAGSLRKTSHILLALAQAYQSRDKPPVTYYALDLERKELLRTLDVVDQTIGKDLRGKVDTQGMWGTYDGGIAYIRNGGLVNGPAEDEDELLTERAPSRDPFADQDGPSTKFEALSMGAETPRVPAYTGSDEKLPGDEDDSKSASDAPNSEFGTFISTQTPPTSHPAEEHQPKTDSRSASPLLSDEPAKHPPLHMLFLGSSLGNFPRADAVDFLKALPLRPGSGDTLLLGLDHRNDGKVVELAYNDPRGYTTAFQLNGLRVAERVLEGRAEETDRDYGVIFKKDGWTYYNRWNEESGRHEGYYRSTRKQTVVIPPDIDRPQDPEIPVDFEEGELVNFEYSYKFSDSEALALFEGANLRVVNRWIDSTQHYSVWLLERPAFRFPIVRTPMPASKFDPAMSLHGINSFPPVPSLAEWASLWSLWDNITLKMIPPNMLHVKPIDLRHKCLFYFGHIPAFLDIHLTRILREVGKRKELEGHTEPVYFKDIFERGIDPHVDDTTKGNPHSEVPDKDEDWPSLEEILAFRDRVRARLLRVYEGHGVESPTVEDPTVREFPRDLGRVLWMTWEHEAFHAETLLYMLIQKAGEEGGTNPPAGFVTPSWDVLSKLPAWSEDLCATTVTLGLTTISIGHDDLESEDQGRMTNGHEFGWDNESPKRSAEVGSVKMETRPILNGEYHEYWLKSGKKPFPALWTEDAQGNIMVKTLYGPVALSVAKNWPFLGSYDETNAFAQTKGGRLPSEYELRLYMDLYAGAEDSNIGFRNWHPIPPLPPQDGRPGHNGGVWEWTSTKWNAHAGFEKSALYPGYSSDFFDDGLHQTVLGGSYATAPRLAQRRTLRNWYQRNYPYAWIGGRVVYDV